MITLSSNTKYTIAGVAILAAFAGGRYSVRQPEVKTTEQLQINTLEDKAKDTHIITTVVTVKEPDGSEKTTKNTETTITAKGTVNSSTTAQIQQTVTPAKTGTLNVSALVGNDFGVGVLKPVYGVSVSKEILGPITVGAFGLTSGMVGLSIGLNF